MNKIVLHGFLEKYGKEYEFDVPSLSDCLRMLFMNFPSIRKEIRDEHFHVVKGESYENAEDLKLNDNKYIAKLKESNQTFHIMPVLDGGKGGFFQAILGVVLLGISYVFPVTAPFLVPAGIGLLAGGVIQMLTPTPSIPDYSSSERPEDRASYIFNGPLNRQEQGGPIPLIYGRCLVGSIIASVSIVNEDL
jgi:predicted phage tail protein